jgi:hypothetical protein
MYGSENLTVNRSERRKTETADIKILRVNKYMRE